LKILIDEKEEITEYLIGKERERERKINKIKLNKKEKIQFKTKKISK